MEKRFSKRSLIGVLLILMIALFFYQYGRYIKTSVAAENHNAISHIAPIYQEVAEYVTKTYYMNDKDPKATLSKLNFSMYSSDYRVIVTDNSYMGFGNIYEASGSLVFRDKSGSAESISQYLRACKFKAGYNLYDFVDNYTYTNKQRALSCFLYEDEEHGINDYYYIYYEPFSDIRGIDVILIANANYVDGEIAVINSASLKLIATQITIVLLIIIWILISHVMSTLAISRIRSNHENAQRRYKAALAGKNNYLWEYYLHNDSMFWDEANPISEPILDVSGANRKEMLLKGKLYEEDRWPFYQFCDDLVSDEPYVSTEVRALSPDGEFNWYKLTGTKVYSDSGAVVSVIGQTIDINKEKIETEALRAQAAQDSLTKLYNYESFSEIADKQISDNKDAVIMALMLVDVDDFTSLNDSFGYVFADAVLVDVAGRLRKLLPDDALIGRYGGDEFVVLLNNVPSMSYVVDIAQSILSSVHGALNNSKTRYRLSCSIGISLFPVDDSSYDKLFEKADMALYDAKSRGKGRFSVYNSNMKQPPESTKTKNAQKLKLSSAPANEHSIIDNSILVNTIDILFDSKDLNFSITMILSIIGIYYNLEHLSIILFDHAGETATISHEWSAEGTYSIPDSIKRTPTAISSLFRGYEDCIDSCYASDDIRDNPNQLIIGQDSYLTNVRSLIQYGIKYRSNYTGYINISCSEPRSWTKNEVDSLSLLAKLIGSYLLQLRSQETIDYVSQMDALTGVYNQSTFITKSDLLLSAGQSKKYAVLYADILQFKLINDNFGYTEGDEILIKIAEILQQVGDQNSLIARVTADRFVALYTYEDDIDLLDKVRKLVYLSKRIPQPNGDYYRLTLMIGVYPLQVGDSALVAIDRANIARKNITDYHNCSYMYYNDTMHENLIEQKDIEDTMEAALQNEEFIVYYQPKLNLQTHELVGAEALVRWKKPDGIVPPDRFIPIFEENGFIVQLDYYVLEKTCEAIRRTIDAGYSPKPVSVNFSRVHFNNTALPTMLEITLQRYRIPPELIEVEITESALNAGNMYQLRILDDIHNIGCRLSMDDFGSGMSSLNILRELPFDVLKIDKDFLHNKVMTQREQVVIRNVVHMATELEMDVICEGVETVEQEEFLKNIGCPYGQGYLYSKPIPEAEFIEKYNKK